MTIVYPQSWLKHPLGFGHSTQVPDNKKISILLKLTKIRLKKGYDCGTVFWGLPSNNLYRVESNQEVETESGLVTTIEFAVRAASRDLAKEEVKKILPNAIFDK
ncbi:hypothetical protein FD723_40790 (plasmid) [Nostoc sp. C052]|uniref:hypothetical protein n=1 Tax=Nostoc sp. C052 TaxID=2576902 RepID=UPI0015C3C933|nr:hypothetical protein [Nostoc sp. C052]QLE46553.1 hypothetical protein FD723_40790 [Nostoc sp. C052]